MAWLIRDLGDGSITGLLLASSKKPAVPSGFEATQVDVVSDDGGDALLLNDNCTKVGVGSPTHSSIDFEQQYDAAVWRTKASYDEWKDELDE